MRTRVTLRLPGDEPIVRDIVEGRWSETEGEPDETLATERLWALPGLVDAHAHLAAREGADWEGDDLESARVRARAALARGVTLLLDKGWRDLTVIRMLEVTPAESRPVIEAAGRSLAVEGGYWPGFAAEVPPGAVARDVERSAVEGAGWVKLIGDWPRKGLGPVANFTEAELRIAVEVAAKHDARVAIHTMAREIPAMAVRAGVHSIEHGLFLNEEDVGSLGSRDGMWVPTVLRVETLIRQLGAESTGGRLLREGLVNVRRLLPMAAEAGVRVLTGSDLAVPAASVAEEAIRLTHYGLPPSHVVRAVGFAGFEATGRAAGFQPGAAADAVFFAEDPVRSPAVLRHPELVLRLGWVVR